MRANTGRDLIVKIEGTLPRPPRLADVLRGAGPGADRRSGASGHGAAGDGDPAGVRRPGPGRAVQRSRRGGAGFRRERGPDRRDDRGAGDDELRRGPAAARLPAGSARPLPPPRGLPRLRRGQDRGDDRVGRRRRGIRRPARHRHAREGVRRRCPVRGDRRDRGALRARPPWRSRHRRDVQREPADDGRGEGDLARGPHARCVRAPARDRPRAEGRHPADHRPVPAPRLRDGDRREGLGHVLADGGARVPGHDRDRRADHATWRG